MEVESFPERPRRKTTLVINDICTCLTFNIMQGFACTGKSFATDSGVLQTGDIKITGLTCGSVEFWLSRSRGKFLPVLLSQIFCVAYPSVSSCFAHLLHGENLLY